MSDRDRLVYRPGVLSDIEIADRAELRPIESIAGALGVVPDELELFGRHKAKLRVPAPPDEACRGKLILVTSITAARQGGGKTVMSIGLGQAFGKLGLRHAVCLRQPSLGPTLGIKGGAAGGGWSQVVPMADINLHFTGDMHAVTAAHNLLAALCDNHAHFGLDPAIDRERIVWPRVLDLCDRQLRYCRIGLGAPRDGFAHDARFHITAASELMAVLALARDESDLRGRLSRMVVAYDRAGAPVRAEAIGAVGALQVLLQKALWPNLVQTLEHTPALVHCGPFANVAHGCNSVVATRFALSRCDYVITEAGFAADLGAEKFLHLKCRKAGLWPAVAVLVASCPGLRRQGGAADDELLRPDLEALRRGLGNARAHIENLRAFGLPVVVALNAFPGDSAAEVGALQGLCDELGCALSVSRAFAEGGEGSLDLARAVKTAADASTARPRYLYDLAEPLADKLERVARRVYRADGIELSERARADIERLHANGFGELPLCIAKTPHSLSDRDSRVGVPSGWKLRVRRLEAAAGAGFVVVETGRIVRMPGMPKAPGALRLRLDTAGRIRGLS